MRSHDPTEPLRPRRQRRAGPTVVLPRLAPGPQMRRVAVALAVWAAGYAAYRFYDAFGGRVGMIGRPAPSLHFRRDNLGGGAIILLGALLPSIAVSARRYRTVRRLVPAVGWIVAVGCCMHALTLVTLRVLSLTGVHPTHYPPGLWLSIDRRKADLQDLLFNEPWFFVEACLWALFALTALQPPPRQRWLRSVVVACGLATAVGLLSGLGAIPTFRSG
ncbi:MAG TPA: hypothetical protein VHJ39_08005 [Solirubrobacteraceae bacterium]|nr:hypothetical protein [Solirubrobacteraceae bacterium]